MELLIGLIVFLFRAMFGEREEAADMERERRQADARRKSSAGRSSGGQAGATLEEILAGMRRDVNPGPGVAPKPQPPRQRAVIAEPEPEPSPRQEFRSSFDPVPASNAQPAQGKKKKKKKQPELEPVPEHAVPLSELLPPVAHTSELPGDSTTHSLFAEPQPPQQPGPKPTARLAASFLHRIRDSNHQQKTAIAQSAVVLMEVFGPPRCKRPFRGMPPYGIQNGSR
jgi:hypothetical protein